MAPRTTTDRPASAASHTPAPSPNPGPAGGARGTRAPRARRTHDLDPTLEPHPPAVERGPLADVAPAPRPTAATAAGTRRFAARFEPRYAADFYRPAARGHAADAPLVSSVGVGTYLGECTDDDDARYESALGLAFASGCNLVDTAINYRCQRSERAVGRALARAIADGTVRRDEIVVCTKGGYVALDGAPPATRDDYDAYLAREYFGRGVMAPADVAHGGHCLAPSFLRDQVARSRANLGVETIDVYYLHNPEQQLGVLEPEAFRAALRGAFETLEACVADGAIARYGVATWRALRVPPGAKGHLALTELVALARDVAGAAHHLAAVQLPVSLGMLEAVRVPTQPPPGRPGRRPVPLVQVAHDLGVSVIGSAPLMQAQLARGLPPQLRGSFPACETDAQRAIAFVRALPGVCATLVGMRSDAHVVENLRAARPDLAAS